MIGITQLKDRKELKDFLAYIRFVVNPQDIDAFKRVYYIYASYKLT